MSKSTIVVFIIDDDFDELYFTTPDEYSLILDKHNITPDRVKYKNITVEQIMLLLNHKYKYLVRQ